MRRSLFFAKAILISAATLAQPSQAEDDKYYYAGFHAGMSVRPDHNLQGRVTSPLNIGTESKVGGVGGVYIGRNINDWRVEFEYALRHNNFNSITVNNADTLPLLDGFSNAQGSVQSDSLMANLHYKFAEADDWKAYAGIGAGMTLLELDNLRSGDVLISNSRAWEPSMQAMLQITRSLGGLEMGLGVRHFRSFRAKLDTEALGATYRNHVNEVFARISWKFGESKSRPAEPAPAPMPVAEPAPAPVVTQAQRPAAPVQPEPTPAPLPGPYMVFFEFDKSNLTADALSILDVAAEDYREHGAARIKATGHADRSGTSKYNLALAMRRAEAVRDALVARGIPVRSIRIRSLGETSPLVPTEDGVREWQNRRVEIVLTR